MHVKSLWTITISESIEETQCQTWIQCECCYKNNDIRINAKKIGRGKSVPVEFMSEGFLLKLFLTQWKYSTEIFTSEFLAVRIDMCPCLIFLYIFHLFLFWILTIIFPEWDGLEIDVMDPFVIEAKIKENTWIQLRSKGTKHPISYFFIFLWTHVILWLKISENFATFTVDRPTPR